MTGNSLPSEAPSIAARNFSIYSTCSTSWGEITNFTVRSLASTMYCSGSLQRGVGIEVRISQGRLHLGMARRPGRRPRARGVLTRGAARAPRRAYFLPAASSSASRPCWSLIAWVLRLIRSPVSHRNGRTPFASAF
jgi:hypothetical protein